MKLLAEPGTGKLIGGQFVGGEGIKERADFLAFALKRGATLEDLAWMENVYSPPIGALYEPHVGGRPERDGEAVMATTTRASPSTCRSTSATTRWPSTAAAGCPPPRRRRPAPPPARRARPPWPTRSPRSARRGGARATGRPRSRPAPKLPRAMRASGERALMEASQRKLGARDRRAPRRTARPDGSGEPSSPRATRPPLGDQAADGGHDVRRQEAGRRTTDQDEGVGREARPGTGRCRGRTPGRRASSRRCTTWQGRPISERSE